MADDDDRDRADRGRADRPRPATARLRSTAAVSRSREEPRTAGASATARRSRGSTPRRPSRATSSSSRRATACSSAARTCRHRTGRRSRRSTRRPRSRWPRSPGPPRPDVDKAIRSARRATGKSWGQLPGRERAKYLFRIARILQERSREFAVLESMDSGKPIKESRDVDVPLAAAHFWYYAGWADKLDYAFPGRVARPARGGRPGHPLELPAAHARLEDRPGARRRQHGRAQAGQHDAAERAALRRRLPPGGPAGRGRQHRHRSGRHRDGARHPPGRRQGRVHRLDGGRQAHRQGDRRAGQGAHPRARREGRQHRVRRRPARPGDRGDRQRDLLQPGRGVLRRLAPARPGVDRRAAHRQAQGPPGDDPGRRPARQEHRRRGDQLEGPARQDHRARGRRGGRGRRPLPAGLRAARARLLLPPDAVHERRPEPPDRPGGDLRAGPLDADVPDARGGDREGQQHARTGCRPGSGPTRAAGS